MNIQEEILLKTNDQVLAMLCLRLVGPPLLLSYLTHPDDSGSSVHIHKNSFESHFGRLKSPNVSMVWMNWPAKRARPAIPNP
jgi:hypothetical protein